MIIQPTTEYPLSIPGAPDPVSPMTRDASLGGSISSTSSNPGIDTHIFKQFPQFVVDDHPQFLQFIEQYYKWMESSGQPLRESREIIKNIDIDTASDEYEDHLFNEFLSIIPRNVVADKSTILKYAKQFYTARGTEKSFKFLFRILLNSDSHIYYPKTDILRVSDGKWIQNKTLRVIDVTGDVKNFRAKKIIGKTNNCTAFVERVYGINFGIYTAYELVLNTASITGKFLPDEVIVAADDSVSAIITPIPESVAIIRPGKNYSVGDKFKIEYIGTGAVLRVIDIDSTGGIKKLYVEEYGVGYSSKNPPKGIKLLDSSHTTYLQNTTTDNTDTAIIDVVLGSQTKYPGYFRNEDGQPSARKYIQDGDFYQQFSYVTYCEQSYNTYSDVLNKTLHPLGFKLFAGVISNSSASASVKSTGSCPVKIITTLDEPSSKTKIKNIHAQVLSKLDSSFLNKLGPSYASVLRDKFTYKPFVKYDANIEMNDNNLTYYGPQVDSGQTITSKLASTPVSCFEYEKFSNDVKDIGPRHIEGNIYEFDQESYRYRRVRVDNTTLKRTKFLPDSTVILDADRVVTQLSGSTKIVVDGGDTTQKVIQVFITNDTNHDVHWKISVNGKTTVSSGIVAPNTTDHSIQFNFNFVELANGQYTWETDSGQFDVPYQQFRLALFATDNLGRTYKSDNIEVKYLESNV